MRMTSIGALPRALAAARPPKPPPTITTRGVFDVCSSGPLIELRLASFIHPFLNLLWREISENLGFSCRPRWSGQRRTDGSVLIQILLTEWRRIFNPFVMSPLLSGLVSGLIFGLISVGMMLPMSFPDKTAALLGAFLNRFGIGLVIALVQLPSWPGWMIGLVFGLLLSLPSAIITKAYAPILIIGALGGLIIGG